MASPARAHGFGQRFDLPLPLSVWLIGAAATIILTFAMIALLVRDRASRARPPSIELTQSRLVRALVRSRFAGFVRAMAIALFVLSIGAGLFGTQSPYTNLIVTMVWIVWWVGFAFVCALIGNVWALVNPLRTIFSCLENAYEKLTHRPRSRVPTRYARAIGAWPAVVLFWVFAWCELVWRGKDVPSDLAVAVIGYALVTWLGMLAFGTTRWLENGEAFSLAFGVLARFAPLDIATRDGSRVLNLRPPGAGLMVGAPVSFSCMFFVLLMLATVTFDGFQETPLMQRIDTAAQMSRATATLLFELSEWGLDETQLVHTAALVAFPLLFLAAFWTTCALMVWLAAKWHGAGEYATRVNDVARTFVLTLVPIAVAYHLSHYFSLLLTAGQFVIPLASDPFGLGWNLLGTAQYKVDYGIASPYLVWYTAATLIVIGHVIAVYLAHADALRLFGTRRAALASQIPMMLLMVAYTTLSLWIFAQPIVG